MRPTKPAAPANPSIPKWPRRAPAVKMIIIAAPIMTVPVPKSGWSMIRPKASPTNPSGGIRPLPNFVMSHSSLLSHLERNRIMPSFINSDGWIPNELMPSQLRAPPRTTPIPGINTMTSSTKQTIKAILAYFFHTRKSILAVKNIATSPSPAKSSCRLTK